MLGQATMGLALLIAWLVMYVLLLAACAMIYKAAKARGSRAEVWLLATLIPGIVGLAIMLVPFIFPQDPSTMFCTIFGVLLTALGPILYLVVGGVASDAE
ncbi:MAG TPA: hypothetical protein ENF78_02130 [Candidatus Bathyarchaeota archaeon]|nr:hypothetical protein [Candidatus Bathyarchaeota archaeon]